MRRAVLTHAHADHARPGSEAYLVPEPALPLFRRRLGGGARLEPLAFGDRVTLDGASVSFHPAGHLLGSAQVRVERRGEVWVVSGDYKRQADPSCEPFEPVACDVFVTEATFGLPVYRWPDTSEVADEVFAWWRTNREAGRTSLLLCYALGKAQRLLAELARRGDGRALLHGALVGLVEEYRAAGIPLLPTEPVGDRRGEALAGELVLAPPAARRSPWMRRFPEVETAFASGWMRVRGAAAGRGVDRGFVLSDHADWPALLDTVRQTGAHRVWTTHGATETLARYLREEAGLDARPLRTAWKGEEEGED